MPPPSSSSSKSQGPPKGIQYWTLLVLALAVSSLYLLEIYLSHQIIKEQHVLIDQREIADGAPYYKDGWQKLAVEVYKVSAQDPTMLDYLKSEGVGVHQGPPPTSAPVNSTNAAPAAPAPTDAGKAAPLSQPATP
ncbi:MAG TPA: hypothetical protein VHY09_16030 [Candidatus Methylacidiphilales bacterium]|nr:hypothetical protein [Candidatus Methylacidiphilales bacterium]